MAFIFQMLDKTFGAKRFENWKFIKYEISMCLH